MSTLPNSESRCSSNFLYSYNYDRDTSKFIILFQTLASITYVRLSDIVAVLEQISCTQIHGMHNVPGQSTQYTTIHGMFIILHDVQKQKQHEKKPTTNSSTTSKSQHELYKSMRAHHMCMRAYLLQCIHGLPLLLLIACQ